MDAQISAYVTLYQNDLDALPYKFYDSASLTDDFGHFTSLTPQDCATVQSWSYHSTGWFPGDSAFYPNWCNAIQTAPFSLLKLYSIQNPTDSLLGLLRLDISKTCEDRSLRLLETSPIHQSRSPGRRYYGIGKALVARCVIDCYMKGQKTLFVRVLERNKAFYRQLGFISDPLITDRMALPLPAGEMFLKDFFF